MFKRVLLCHDGTLFGRRALKRGAELAILLHAEVHVLTIRPVEAISPATAAAIVGSSYFGGAVDYEATVAESVQRLNERGVIAHGHVAQGKTIPQIVRYARHLEIDLIVVGHYPTSGGKRWWSGAERDSLAEQVACSVLIATD